MNIKHLLLKIMVINMRWMTKYFGFIARPFILWYANQEIIACGLRNQKGKVNIIYTPTPNRKNHAFFKKQKKDLIPTISIDNKSFSGNVVLQITLPEANLNDVLKVRAETVNKEKYVKSPNITVKKITEYRPELLETVDLGGGRLKISWKKAKTCNPMIYFLAIEDDKNNTLAAIYTRETSWIYPNIKKASLSIGMSNPPAIINDKNYVAKLIVVDFDGWVPCIEVKSFTL